MTPSAQNSIKKIGLAALLCLLAVFANPAESKTRQPTAKVSLLVASVLQSLEQTSEYKAMTALYEDRRKREGAAWVQSEQGQKIAAALKRFRAVAATTNTAALDTQGRESLAFTNGDGRVTILGSVVVSDIETNKSQRENAADLVARFIIDRAVRDGLIPYDLSSDVSAAMKKAYAAAAQSDYLAALEHFENAHDLAPTAAAIHYNLALAESRIPGRELRAIAWYGAFLAADPKSTKAQAIREQIPKLNSRGSARFLKIVQGTVEQIPSQSLKDAYLTTVAKLWAKTGDYAVAFQTVNAIQSPYERNQSMAEIASAQAGAADINAALETLAGISFADARSSAQLSISEAQSSAGNIAAALKTADGIRTPFIKSLALQRIADAQRETGSTADALRTLADALSIASTIEEPLRSRIHEDIAVSQAAAREIAVALRTADSIADPFNISLAKQRIAEIQARAGDAVGARQTLAAALDAAGKEKDASSRSILMEGYAESKARIDSGKAVSPAEQPGITAPPSVKPQDWISMNDSLLNAPVFKDLAKYMKTLPQSDPAKILSALFETAGKMVEAHEAIGKMLQQQAIEHKKLNASGA